MECANNKVAREGAEHFWRDQAGLSGARAASNFSAFLARACEQSPQKLAMIYREFAYTYADLFSSIAGVAAYLRQRDDLQSGARVALLLENTDLYNIWYLGILAADLIAVPLNTKLSKREIEFMLIDSETRMLLSEEKFSSLVNELRESGRCPAKFEFLQRHHQPVKADWKNLLQASGSQDDAAVYYTSGTTGHPKGVVHTHRSLIAGAVQGAPSWEYDDRDAINLAVTPLFHIANHTVFLPTLMVGGTLVVDTFKTDEIFALIRSRNVTHFFAVPSILLLMLDQFQAEGEPLTSVRGVFFGAAPMPMHRLSAVQRMFPNATLVHGMGQTESCGTIVTLPSRYAFEKAGSVGVNIAGMDIRIVDDDDVEVMPNVVGELVARGPNVMSRYLNNSEATSATLKGGWLHTGDLGYRDESGFVYLVDRKKDMIIRGGENIYSTEVEHIIATHPYVANVAVIGFASELYGEEVMACIVKRAGAPEISLAELQSHCSGQLAKFKIPVAIRYFDVLPQTSTGKIQKAELKKAAANRPQP
jgi:acyl-CoA synthetase (AMP-forming)/AMP-acid ligase II